MRLNPRLLRESNTTLPSGGGFVSKLGAIGGGRVHNNNNIDYTADKDTAGNKVQNGGGHFLGGVFFDKKGECQFSGAQNQVFVCEHKGPKMLPCENAVIPCENASGAPCSTLLGRLPKEFVAPSVNRPQGLPTPPKRGGRVMRGRPAASLDAAQTGYPGPYKHLPCCAGRAGGGARRAPPRQNHNKTTNECINA